MSVWQRIGLAMRVCTRANRYWVLALTGYRQQLAALERLFGEHEARYFSADLGGEQGLKEARGLWPGRRGIEEHAGEAILLEERPNGRKWVDKWLVRSR